MSKNHSLFLGRHCFMKAPNYLLGSFQQALNLKTNALTFFLGSPHSMSRKDLLTLRVSEFQEELKKNN